MEIMVKTDMKKWAAFLDAIDENGGTEEGFLFFTTRSLVRKLKELGLAD